MNIILTEHVKTRRKQGNIPAETLHDVAKHLIKQHNLPCKANGSYKFTIGRTHAVIQKSHNKFIFITFFGPTGWVIECEDFGVFDCAFQSEELILEKRERNKRLQERGYKHPNNKKPAAVLSRLSKDNKKRLDKGTFEIIELTNDLSKSFKEIYGQNPAFALKSKFNHTIVDLLTFAGSVIKSIHINQYNEISKKTSA